MITGVGLVLGLVLAGVKMGAMGAAAFLAAVAVGIPVLLWILDSDDA